MNQKNIILHLKCEWCNSEFDLRKDLYKLRIKRNVPIICKKCMNKRTAERNKARYENLSEEEKQKFKDKCNWHSKLSDEEKEAHAQRTRDQLANRTPEEWAEVNKKNSEGLKAYWNTVSQEEKDRRVKELHAELKAKLNTYTSEDWKKRYAKALANMTPERREEYRKQQSDKMKAYNDSLSYEEKVKRAQAMQKWHKNLTPKEKKELYAKTHEWTKAPGMKEKISQEKKDYWNNLDDETKKERVGKVFSNRGYNNLNTKFENAFNNSILINSYYYMNEYKMTNGEYKHAWDYGIFSVDTKELVAVVDLDGAYYHADINDYDGVHSREERDENRLKSIPPDSKCLQFIIYELNFYQSFENMLQHIIMDYNQYVDSIFQMCRRLPEFPFPEYSDDDLIKAWGKLKLLNPNDEIYNSVSLNTRIGDRLINHFHKEIWSANISGKMSPYDAWKNDEALKKCIRNRLIYQTKLNPNKIVQGFNVSRIAPKVSVFSAGRAKIIINKYLSEYTEIFDPFSGFSGRLLGTLASDKIYIGQDIAEPQVDHSNEILNFLRDKYLISDTRSSITHRDTVNSTGTYKCLFTCPPYSDKEQWFGCPITKRSCDDWIDICLKNFNCQRYVFIVDITKRYSNYIADIITNKSHMSRNKEYIIVINK